MKIIDTYGIFLPKQIGGVSLFYLVIFLRKIDKKCFVLLTTHKKYSKSRYLFHDFLLLNT